MHKITVMEKENIAVGLDIGTTKIVAMIGKKNEYGKLEILGVGKSKSLGVARGVVNNITQTIQSIQQAIAEAAPVTFQIGDWEWRWPLGSYAKRDGLSAPMRERLASGMAMTAHDYRRALRRRREIRDQYAQLVTRFDGVLLLGATGAAPAGLSWTGDTTINVPASLLGTPAISLPLLTDDGMPLGLQIIGRADEDAALLGVAEWVWQHYADDR